MSSRLTLMRLKRPLHEQLHSPKQIISSLSHEWITAPSARNSYSYYASTLVVDTLIVTKLRSYCADAVNLQSCSLTSQGLQPSCASFSESTLQASPRPVSLVVNNQASLLQIFTTKPGQPHIILCPSIP